MSGTAIVHQEAELSPGKLDLLAGWLPAQPWYLGPGDDLERIAAYRFVDPDGEVGIETLLVRSGGAVYQVPLTYRAAALADEGALAVGTLNHSVLGPRWVYDATTDPVYIAELIRVIREADNEAALSSGNPSMSVRGSGTALAANAAGQTVRIARVLDDAHDLDTARALGLLTGTWSLDAEARETVLAVLR